MYEDNVRTGPAFVVMDVMMSWSKEILPIVCFFTSGACSTAMGYAAALLRHDGWMDDTQGSTALLINTCDDLEAPFLEFPCRKAPRNPTTPPIRCCWCRLSGSDLVGARLQMCEQLLDVSDDTEDEEENREYIEEANADTVMFALAKLVATDTVAKEHLAPDIISHLEKYGASVGEIVKHLLTGLKKKGDVSNILVEALKRAHQRYLAATSSGNDEESSKKFQECKDLAARLSGSYVGVARNKYKSEILNVVREGINYAFSDAPKQLSFLEGAVLYFVSKLPASDILDIIKGVERRTENLKTDEDPSGWRAYYTFVDTLREKYLKNEVPKGASS